MATTLPINTWTLPTELTTVTEASATLRFNNPNQKYRIYTIATGGSAPVVGDVFEVYKYTGDAQISIYVSKASAVDVYIKPTQADGTLSA